MLEEILDGNIQTVDFVKDWEESIKIASKPLLEKNIIKKKYVEAMIESIKKLGFYVVLRENLAMPHARPEEGAIDTGISLLKLKQPVNYGDEKVYIVIVLASKDSDSHTEILMKLVELFQDDESIEELIKAETIEEVRRVVGKY
jgi:Phosphotransferase system mannitol/fructose-specific IIA domain (Ntr-type)